MNHLLVFGSSLILTLLLGIQSKNVNQSRYLASAVTSMCLVGCQIMFTHFAIKGTPLDMFLMMLAGAIGIMSSIWLHDRFTQRQMNEKKDL